jgi:hypothetical protein
MVCALCAASLLVPGTASAALADDPPPTTTTAPAPEPTPDPAPPVKPKPQPRPKPASSPTPQQSAPAPAPAQQPQVVQTQKPAVAKKTVPRSKPKKKHPKAAPKPLVVVPKVKTSQTLGASVGLRSAVNPDGSTNVGSLLVVLGLALAITCFAVAMVPARSVPWRPAAIFMSEHQANMTIFGFGLLLAAGFTLFWINGF